MAERVARRFVFALGAELVRAQSDLDQLERAAADLAAQERRSGAALALARGIVASATHAESEARRRLQSSSGPRAAELRRLGRQVEEFREQLRMRVRIAEQRAVEHALAQSKLVSKRAELVDVLARVRALERLQECARSAHSRARECFDEGLRDEEAVQQWTFERIRT